MRVQLQLWPAASALPMRDGQFTSACLTNSEQFKRWPHQCKRTYLKTPLAALHAGLGDAVFREAQPAKSPGTSKCRPSLFEKAKTKPKEFPRRQRRLYCTGSTARILENVLTNVRTQHTLKQQRAPSTTCDDHGRPSRQSAGASGRSTRTCTWSRSDSNVLDREATRTCSIEEYSSTRGSTRVLEFSSPTQVLANVHMPCRQLQPASKRKARAGLRRDERPRDGLARLLVCIASIASQGRVSPSRVCAQVWPRGNYATSFPKMTPCMCCAQSGTWVILYR